MGRSNHLADVHQLDHIQRRQYLQEAKLQPKVKVVVYESEADNSGKITIAIQYRHKKLCTNCQDHGEMKPLLKQKLKDQLQRTRQSARNKESRTLGLETIGKIVWTRKDYLLFFEIEWKKRICNSQSKD